jgi:acyl-coenzyme A thioesterase PaaI-like protein
MGSAPSPRSPAPDDLNPFLVLAEPLLQGSVQQLWQVVITRRDDGKTVARGQVRLQNVDLPQGG